MNNFLSREDKTYTEEILVRLELQKKCLEKHMFAPPIITIELKLSNEEDKPLWEKVLFSQTYVRNFYSWLVSQMAGAHSTIGGTAWGDGSLVVRNLAGTNHSHTSAITNLNAVTNITSSAGSHTIGIVIGRGTTAESFEHFALASVIAHGTASGQINYHAGPSPTRTWDSGTRLFTVHQQRSFENLSGAAISVTEIGHIAILSAPTLDSRLFIRDLLPAPISIPNGNILRVTYNYSITYPS